jgi:hypothetical protein
MSREAEVESALADLGRCLDRAGVDLAFHPTAEAVATDPLPNRVCAIGLDTNALRFLRVNLTSFANFTSAVEGSPIKLIIPGQALQEFWNNHRTFTKDLSQLEKDKSLLNQAAQKLKRSASAPEIITKLESLEALISDIELEIDTFQNPEAFQNSSQFWKELNAVSDTFYVPRTRFFGIGQARFASKTPPGFEDVDKYPRHLGDFFVWADFLLGLRLQFLRDELGPSDGKVVFITDDAKQDWQTAGRAHPFLSAEVWAMCERPLEIVETKQISSLAWSNH